MCALVGRQGLDGAETDARGGALPGRAEKGGRSDAARPAASARDVRLTHSSPAPQHGAAHADGGRRLVGQQAGLRGAARAAVRLPPAQSPLTSLPQLLRPAHPRMRPACLYKPSLRF